jgi:hypothetical protein
MSGYYCLRADGRVAAFGDVPVHGSAEGALDGTASGIAVTPDGYWVSSRRGQVAAFGVPDLVGSERVQSSGEIVDLAATVKPGGLWVLDAAGGVFCYGSASFCGSVPGLEVDAPVPAVAITPTPDDEGYWILDQAGGVFCFGTARYFGSVPELRSGNAPAVALLAGPEGDGYTVVTEDGTCLAFGRAPDVASVSARHPITGAALAPDGALLVDAEGIVYPVGMAPFLGSPMTIPSNAPIVDVAWIQVDVSG